MRSDRPKGLVRAKLIQVLRKGPRPALTSAAEESLFRRAEFLFEGTRDRDRFFASFMMQISLDRLRTEWREMPTPEQLQSILEGSVRVRIRLARLALREVVARYPNERLGPVELDARCVVDANTIRIDLDLEAERILLAQVVDSE